MALRFPMIAALGVLLVVAPPGAARADTPDSDESAPFYEMLPTLRLLGHVAAGGVFGDVDVAPATGENDFTRSGFQFQKLELGLDGLYGGHFNVFGGVEITEDGVHLHRGYVAAVKLPWDLAVRAGLLVSQLGYENERHSEERAFVDQPLALGKLFGPVGHQSAGVDLAFTIPAPWSLRLFAGMGMANGEGQRSWYGDADPIVEGLRDFVYHVGIENIWDFGEGITLAVDLHGAFGPNDSGRSNGTDIFGYAMRLGIDEDDIDVVIETEWFLRRRQVIGDVLQDAAGWLTLGLGFEGGWSLGARYEFLQGLDEEPLDVADTDNRHRAGLSVGWSPVSFARLRLSGYADVGGPLGDDTAGVVMLHLEAGYTVCPAKEEGRCTTN